MTQRVGRSTITSGRFAPPAFSAVQNPADWNTLVASLPFGHILQSWEWGEFKSRYGWSARRWVRNDADRPVAAAQILRRTLRLPASHLSLPTSLLYVPKGPLLHWDDESLRARVLDDLQSLARRERAVFIKIDPDVPTPSLQTTKGDGEGIITDLQRQGWVFSRDQIQFRNTVTLDLRRSEAEILAAMKQKTRYNVRLAEKKGVRVRSSPGSPADLDMLYRLYAETSVRDGFVIRSADYYRDAWGSFIEAGLAQPFIAEVEGEPVSALILFKFARTAWYMYGMSREAHREKMPNHLLQWEAMRWAKANGCETYDFWGAPDEFNESDPMWGVWKFKEGFGGQIVRRIGAWDYAPSPLFYWMYTVVMPKVLDVMRWRGKQQTRRMLE
jgi:lipid II:glycine glycyltransferase (peptidoglycan interpeptide bridge formation enzyme)